MADDCWVSYRLLIKAACHASAVGVHCPLLKCTVLLKKHPSFPYPLIPLICHCRQQFPSGSLVTYNCKAESKRVSPGWRLALKHHLKKKKGKKSWCSLLNVFRVGTPKNSCPSSHSIIYWPANSSQPSVHRSHRCYLKGSSQLQSHVPSTLLPPLARG